MSEQKDFLKNVTTIFENAEKQARNVYNAVNETYNSMSNIEEDTQKESNLKELADLVQGIDDQLFMFKECVMDLNRICTDSLKNIDSKLSQISQSLNKTKDFEATRIENSINRFEESIKKSEHVGDVLQNIEDEQRAQTKKMDEFIELSSTKINNMEKALRQAEETLRLLLANNLLNEFDISTDKSNKEESGSVDDKITKTLLLDSITDDKKKTEEQFSPEELCNKGYEAKGNEDYKTAFEYFNQAHKKGYIPATVAVGDMYRDGDYLSQNYSKAFELYNFAAMKNDTRAMVRLFFAYKDGNGVPQNLETRKKWLERASSMGSSLAMSTLVELYCGNYGFTPDYIEAVKWNEKLRALSGYIPHEIDALNALGDFCRNNHNYVEALNYYKKSADYSDANAMCWLGNFYDKGWGTKKNDLLAKEWYEKAADGGDVAAMYNLGCMYRYGGRPNITQNYKKARKWYKKAAENGFSDAMTSLGFMYHTGEGVKLNYDEAIRWYNLAIQSDEPDTTAMCNLAGMYEDGEGVNIDLVRARALYRQAYGAGDDSAKEHLERMGFTKRELIVIKIRYIICEQLGLEYDEVRMESEFINDLGAASSDIVELIMAFEEEFNIEIPDEDAEDIRTVKDVVNYIYNNLN